MMIRIKVGEQKPIVYTMKMKDTGLPVNLVSSTIVFQLKEHEDQIDDFLVEKTITENSDIYQDGQIFDAKNGKFSVFLKREDTLSLDANREYYYTIWRLFEHTKEVISSSNTKVAKFLVYPA